MDGTEIMLAAVILSGMTLIEKLDLIFDILDHSNCLSITFSEVLCAFDICQSSLHRVYIPGYGRETFDYKSFALTIFKEYGKGEFHRITKDEFKRSASSNKCIVSWILFHSSVDPPIVKRNANYLMNEEAPKIYGEHNLADAAVYKPPVCESASINQISHRVPKLNLF